jgi:hypothetical protein
LFAEVIFLVTATKKKKSWLMTVILVVTATDRKKNLSLMTVILAATSETDSVDVALLLVSWTVADLLSCCAESVCHWLTTHCHALYCSIRLASAEDSPLLSDGHCCMYHEQFQKCGSKNVTPTHKSSNSMHIYIDHLLNDLKSVKNCCQQIYNRNVKKVGAKTFHPHNKPFTHTINLSPTQ